MAMHVSKTWLYIACRSSPIRKRLSNWREDQIVTRSLSTPFPQGCELFHKDLPEGVMITYRRPGRGEFFIILSHHCEQRVLKVLDSRKTKVDLDPLTGRFHVQWFDHTGKPALAKTFSPDKASCRKKNPTIQGDQLFTYFKKYYSRGMDWELLLESMVTRTPLEKAPSDDIRLQGEYPTSHKSKNPLS